MTRSSPRPVPPSARQPITSTSGRTRAAPQPRTTGHAAPTEFGGLIREHKVRTDRLIQLWAIPGLTFLAFALATAFGFYRWYFAYARFGPAVVWRWASPAWVLAALLFGLGGLLALRALRVAPRRVHLYAGGLVWIEGRRSRALAWSEIAQIYTAGVSYGLLGMVWGNRVRVTLLPARGRPIRLTEDLAHLDSLLEAIKHSVYPRLLAESRQAFNAGAALAFGPLMLQKDGIVRGARRIPWSSVKAANLESGRLQIQIADGAGSSRLRVSANQIPNADLCLQLIQILGEK
ncbi:MAG: DUF6585 family protein [Anaerolineales bacterium]